jgi:hypothetical protein
MDIKKLEQIMIAHGVVLRAIPEKIVSVIEVYHKDKYPDGRIEYIERYKREMLVVEKIPIHAGKFIFECAKNTNGMIQFYGKRYFDSIDEAVNALLEDKNK